MVLRFSLCIVLFLALGGPFDVSAHGDLHERIIALTKEIKNHPDSAYLLMKRGELYFQHEEPKKSLADFEKCANMGYDDVRLDYNLAKNHFELNDHKKSLEYVAVILSRDQNYVKAYRLKGNVLFDLQRYDEAALAFEKVLKIALSSLPENYMETSVAWQRVGSEEGRQKAVDIIKEGIKELGELITFYHRIEALENARANYQGVVDIQSKIIDQSNRKEVPLYNRGLTYKKMNKTELAAKDFVSAKESIMKLNSRIRARKATKDLLLSIEQELKTK